MNWLDQHDALDQLSPTISEAVENWLDLQQAQEDDRSSACALADFAAPPATSASPAPPSRSNANAPAPPDAPGTLAASRLASGRGYFWKALFLPEGTRLRVFMRGGGHAEVIGNQLVYEGQPTSPNQFLRLFRGIPRNAWEELCIRFPGEKSWRRAKELRREFGIARRRGSILP
ncbi:hypothetical protein [Pseudoduganella violacea]|uniref:Uncharacterized protein n=1 Tax=Pseudoduganella violacea TaxID=1715466 RepID=A0A7W5FUI3_9BURK|nr:hypothetical protein [Pseudoduganella violacea]MBB3119824.1 hypothetical protein [Pseudoduganella violacea]